MNNEYLVRRLYIVYMKAIGFIMARRRKVRGEGLVTYLYSDKGACEVPVRS